MAQGCRTQPQAPGPGPISGRDVAAIMDPRPVVIVGAAKGDEVGLATIIWATPLSHTPPLVAFALRPTSHTMGLVAATGLFSLSTLPADQPSVALTELCGSKTGHSFPKGDAVECQWLQIPEDAGVREGLPAEAPTSLPVPARHLASALCAVASIQDAGDHQLVVGRVLAAESASGRDGKGRLDPVETLLCAQHGHYGSFNDGQADGKPFTQR